MEIERENRKTEILETTLKNISVVLQSNTDVMQGFNKSIYILEDTLEKVSDKLFAHDERSKYLSESLKGINNELLRLKEDAPTINDINLLHQKIDEVKSNVADKKEIRYLKQWLHLKGRSCNIPTKGDLKCYCALRPPFLHYKKQQDKYI